MIRSIPVGLAAAMLSLTLFEPIGQCAITWDLKPPNTGDWDWTLRGNYQWYRDGLVDQPKYSELTGILWATAAAQCVEISTGPGRFTSNPDTRIWAQDVSGAWYSINDDFNGTLQSKARFWINFHVGGGGIYFGKIAPYVRSAELEDFELIVTRRDLTEVQCTTGQTTIPWAKFVGGYQYTLTVSPNHS